jgi:hypothetical protein
VAPELCSACGAEFDADQVAIASQAAPAPLLVDQFGAPLVLK